MRSPVEKACKFWDHVVSDEAVYLAEWVKSNFKIGHCISCFDWLTKYNAGDVYIESKIALFGDWDAYHNCVLEVLSPSATHPVDPDLKFNASHGNDLMFVDVAKFIELPETVILKPCTTMVRLKRFDDGGGLRRHVADGFPISRFGSGLSFVNGERCSVIGSIGGQKRQLPSKVVKAGAETIGKPPAKIPIESGVIFCSISTWCKGVAQIVLSIDGVSVVPKRGNSRLKFVEALIPPIKFHLCVGQSHP